MCKCNHFEGNFHYPDYICAMNSILATPYQTADGSSTFRSLKYGAYYHSVNGAITESEHVFIKYGLSAVQHQGINILEVGFGTGLNAALTAGMARNRELEITYHGIDLYPLSIDELSLINYGSVLPSATASLWKSICNTPWDLPQEVSPRFTLHKQQVDFTQWQPSERYHLVYFDAFAPDDQPEMWQFEGFKKLFRQLHQGGILVTYCAKGTVKDALRAAGFTLDRLQGPPGKRHMLRAWKR